MSVPWQVDDDYRSAKVLVEPAKTKPVTSDRHVTREQRQRSSARLRERLLSALERGQRLLALVHAELGCQDERPLRLTMRDGRIDFFQQTYPEPKELYTGEQVVLGYWKGSTRTDPLVLIDVMDAEYSYDISEDRVKKIYFW